MAIQFFESFWVLIWSWYFKYINHFPMISFVLKLHRHFLTFKTDHSDSTKPNLSKPQKPNIRTIISCRKLGKPNLKNRTQRPTFKFKIKHTDKSFCIREDIQIPTGRKFRAFVLLFYKPKTILLLRSAISELDFVFGWA